ncbi:MAG: HEPN domain-containing protein [Desulfobacterales bacterium]|nr:HEPN domain-containing protein [Desulfobacterales bacterium]MBF0397330.1 HEPN domain-containing protein [Desulfobacterales bacterium]
MKDVYLKKSEESINAAQFCFELEYYNSCINRAYYAMFQAAVAILFKSGCRPKSEKIGHDWVQAEFSKAFVLGNKRFSHLKGLLNLVQEIRDIADYSDEYIEKKKAKRTLDKAIIFVGEILKEVKNAA